MATLSKGFVAAALSAALLTGLASNDAAGAKGDRWYRVGLGHGETSDGYGWWMGASGPKDEPLAVICNLSSTLTPPQDDAPYFEGSDLKACGSLRHPEYSASVSTAVGSEASSQTIFEVLYRPIVRKVTFVLDTGERRVYRPRVPSIPNRAARGIPVFRYIVATFEEAPCIRRVTTFDKGGDVIFNEASPPCPPGQGNM